jgi:hypothetical protein
MFEFWVLKIEAAAAAAAAAAASKSQQTGRSGGQRRKRECVWCFEKTTQCSVLRVQLKCDAPL